MSAKWGRSVADILELLTDKPQTSAEICDALEDFGRCASAVLTRLRRAGRIHIASWRRGCVVGCKAYTRAVYAIGPGIDAAKLKPIPKSQQKRGVNRSRMRIASVFDLALTRAQRVEKLKPTRAEA